MSRQHRRQTLQEMKRGARASSKPYPMHEMVEVPREEWPETIDPLTHLPEKVFRSRNFMAQVYIEPEGHTRISVCKTSLNKHMDYNDGIMWDELQWIKNQIGYADKDCIEIYPQQSLLVNVANMRHLFVLEETHPYTWRK